MVYNLYLYEFLCTYPWISTEITADVMHEIYWYRSSKIIQTNSDDRIESSIKFITAKFLWTWIWKLSVKEVRFDCADRNWTGCTSHIQTFSVICTNLVIIWFQLCLLFLKRTPNLYPTETITITNTLTTGNSLVDLPDRK